MRTSEERVQELHYRMKATEKAKSRQIPKQLVDGVVFLE